MRFSDLAKTKLAQAKDQFGSYSYNDKGPDEVMDVAELVIEVKRLPIDQMISELLHLATREDCALDPAALVRSILGDLDSDDRYEALFEDEELGQYY